MSGLIGKIRKYLKKKKRIENKKKSSITYKNANHSQNRGEAESYFWLAFFYKFRDIFSQNIE